MGIESYDTLIKNFAECLSSFNENTIEYFLSILEDGNVAKELKISLFNLLGDLFLYMPNCVINKLTNFIYFIEMAYLAVYSLQSKPKNDELYIYSELLKDTLVDCFLCIIHGVYFQMP